MPADPAPTNPVATTPAPAVPVATTPAPADPVATTPAPADPVATTPAPAEPVATTPAPAEPAPAEPAPAEPAPATPAPVDPLLPLRTERLVLRPATEADLDDLLRYRTDPEVCRYLPNDPWTEQDAPQQLAERLGRADLGGPTRQLWLVAEHEGRVVGDLSLWAVDGTGAKGAIGWVFDPAAAGRGLATEAATALLDHGFRDHGMHRVAAELDARNTASARLCERLGMTREAHLRQDWWNKGEWTDTLVYASLATDRPRIDRAPTGRPATERPDTERVDPERPDIDRPDTERAHERDDTIVVSAVALADAEGHVLTVRKRGTRYFMNPGGKPDPGESPEACALREVHEELGLDLDPERLDLLGVHRTRAANETGRPLLATVFRHPLLADRSRPEVSPRGEIDAVRWVDPAQAPPADIAPLLRVLLGWDTD